MSGLLRRIRGTRPDPSEPAPDAEAAPDHTAELVIPAGTDLDRLVGDRTTTKRRGRMRRRLRHLRSVREVLLRDLGGLVFEVHRSGDAKDAHSALVDGKLARMATVDTEIRELEAFLDDHKGMTVREPGIGGTCAECGELFGSDARFCWACGTPVTPGATRPPAVERAIVAALPAFVEGTSEELPPPPPPPAPPPPDFDQTVEMAAVDPGDVTAIYRPPAPPAGATVPDAGAADATASTDAVPDGGAPDPDAATTELPAEDPVLPPPPADPPKA